MAETLIDLRHIHKTYDEGGRMPVPVLVDVSLSVGSCDLTSGSYDRVLEALVKADRAMYERKRQYHASHEIEIEV